MFSMGGPNLYYFDSQSFGFSSLGGPKGPPSIPNLGGPYGCPGGLMKYPGGPLKYPWGPPQVPWGPLCWGPLGALGALEVPESPKP